MRHQPARRPLLQLPPPPPPPGSSMGFSCAPPCVWPSPGSRGASCRGAIAAAQGRVPGRGLKGERRRQRQPEPHRGGLGLGNCLRLHESGSLESPCRGSAPSDGPGSQSPAALLFGAADGTPASSNAAKSSLATPIATIL
ncbi:hypothetical protein E5288_WYG015661 [Bos mutus]|uniref:Uncharacterized protein n=1 Tax=Bos mutus TaxID=72004 RepID=A0A6B0S6G2_9CETA|nr:hypothetical protein [Bos mutus]